MWARPNRYAPLGIAVIAATIGCTTTAAETDNPAQHLLNAVQSVTGVPGMSAAVSQDGTVIWAGQAGVSGETNLLNSETKFRLASVSKLFTASLVLKLSEDDILDLDEDIRVYVPEWPEKERGVITLRRLAAHTAGLSHYTSEDHFDPEKDYETLTQAISIYAHKDLLFDPGEDYHYSSYGYTLMGAAIENATGLSYAEALDKFLIGPLELADTHTEENNNLPENTSVLYSTSGEAPTEISRNSQSHVLGATGMLSNPSDLVKFADRYLEGAYVSGKLRDMSWTPHVLSDGSLAGEERFSVGFGWRIGANWDGQKVYHHAGTTPGARSILTVNPESRTAAAFLSNAQWVSRIETTGELFATAATEGTELTRAQCPVGNWQYKGVFVANLDNPPAGNNASGSLSVSFASGVCSGQFAPEGAFGEWFQDRGAQTEYVPLVKIADRKDASIFAIATPWGAFPLYMTVTSEGGTVAADIARRKLDLFLTTD